jgi:hypothetical protein
MRFHNTAFCKYVAGDFDRVNLKHGVPEDGRTTTCTAGAGSLLLEFILLSRLTGVHYIPVLG